MMAALEVIAVKSLLGNSIPYASAVRTRTKSIRLQVRPDTGPKPALHRHSPLLMRCLRDGAAFERRVVPEGEHEDRGQEREERNLTSCYRLALAATFDETGLSAFEIRAPLLTMQSNGGVMTAERARARPVQLIESGPAAGVIGTAAMARRLGVPNVISLDMGGTTTKASVIEEYNIRRSSEFEVGGPISRGSRLNKGGGYLLRTAAIDIAEVGAGGGSILTVDDAGALHVGPRSAGAVPDPVCYGNGGTAATLTDANVTLGDLAQDRLPSGLRLDAAKARSTISAQIASALGLPLEEAAYGAYIVPAAPALPVRCAPLRDRHGTGAAGAGGLQRSRSSRSSSSITLSEHSMRHWWN
jgi:N-methylhydantoinase A/oxoprolinase/acetone carboxylase beta subunit